MMFNKFLQLKHKNLNYSKKNGTHTSIRSISTDYDAIIIGGGHNGLVAANYLAKDAKNVLVLEKRSVIGGAANSYRMPEHPEFTVSRASYLCSLLRPTIIKDLNMEKYGFELIPRDPSSFTPLLDGRYLLMGQNMQENQKSIAQFSQKDAENLPKYEAMMDKFAKFVDPLIDEIPLDIQSDTTTYSDYFDMFKRVRKFGFKNVPDLLEVMQAPADKILRRYFESEPLLSTLAIDAIIGANMIPSTPGSGYVLFHHVMGECQGKRGVWAYVKGGMGKISEALAKSAESCGTSIFTDANVTEILVDEEGGKVTGVKMQDGTVFTAPIVISNATPKITFEDLLAKRFSSFDRSFQDRIKSIDYSSPVTKINFAVDSLPNFKVLPNDANNTPQPFHQTTIHLLEKIEELNKGYYECQRGYPSERPLVEMTIPSSVDNTLAPPGKHVVQLLCQYTPYHLADGKSWDDPDQRKRFLDSVLRVIDDYAPGFSQSILSYDMLTPPDLEREFSLTGGNIFHGSMSLEQLYWMRPVPKYSRYSTPIDGLYMCGAGTHPGGGVTGAAGRNCYNAIMRDE